MFLQGDLFIRMTETKTHNTVQARSGKDTASDWTKTICLTATNSCYKSSFENNLVPRFSRLLQKNFKHQPVGDILFFFPEPLLAQSSKHLTFFRQGMYWDGIKMERPVIMKCCTIICWSEEEYIFKASSQVKLEGRLRSHTSFFYRKSSVKPPGGAYFFQALLRGGRGAYLI